MNEEEIRGYIKKAGDSIYSAEINMAENLYGFSVSRSYYAMFYVVEALLLTKNLSYSSHKAVITHFAREFIKPGIFEKKHFDALTKTFELRQNGDYEPQEVISRQHAEEAIKNAKEFLEEAKRYLKKGK